MIIVSVALLYLSINALALFSHFATMKFCKVEFTNIFCTSKKASRITKMIRSFGFSIEFEPYKSVRYSLCYECSKAGTFFLANSVYR